MPVSQPGCPAVPAIHSASAGDAPCMPRSAGNGMITCARVSVPADCGSSPDLISRDSASSRASCCRCSTLRQSSAPRCLPSASKIACSLAAHPAARSPVSFPAPPKVTPSRSRRSPNPSSSPGIAVAVVRVGVLRLPRLPDRPGQDLQVLQRHPGHRGLQQDPVGFVAVGGRQRVGPAARWPSPTTLIRSRRSSRRRSRRAGPAACASRTRPAPRPCSSRCGEPATAPPTRARPAHTPTAR